MNLSYYIRVFWHRRWIIIATTLVTFSVVAYGTTRLSSTYVATSTVRILTGVSGGSDYFQFDVNYSDRIMNTYAQLVTSRPVLTALLNELDLPSHQLPDVQAELIDNTELLRITVVSPDPVIARDAANFLAQTLIAYDNPLAGDEQTPIDLVPPLPPGASWPPAASDMGRIVATMFESAALPTESTGLSRTPFMALGGIIGLLGGIGLALVFHNLDTRLYSPEKIEQIIRQPVLGEIPSARMWRKRWILLDKDRHAEAFRWLLTNLMALINRQAVKTLCIISAEPQEGKSSVTANLAIAMGQAGLRVVVIDADHRRPAQHTIFKASNDAGLSDVIQDFAPLPDVLQPTSFPGVTVLSSGTAQTTPSQLTYGRRFTEVLGLLEEDYDLILVDTPASLAVADAAALAPRTDGSLLIVRHGHLQQKRLQSLQRQFEQVHARLLGVVINRAKPHSHYHKYYTLRGSKSALQLVPGEMKTERIGSVWKDGLHMTLPPHIDHSPTVHKPPRHNKDKRSS